MSTPPKQNAARNMLGLAATGMSALRLLVDKFFQPKESPETPVGTPIPLGVSTFDLTGAEPVRLPDSATGTVFEPHFRNGRHRLLIVNLDPQTVIYVNDQVYPLLVLAHVGDIFRIGATGPCFEIACYYVPRIGPPAPEQVGKTCPVCLDEISADSRVYTCPCGCVFHLESEGESPMECGLAVSNCPQCQRPIQLAHGFHPSPQFLH